MPKKPPLGSFSSLNSIEISFLGAKGKHFAKACTTSPDSMSYCWNGGLELEQEWEDWN